MRSHWISDLICLLTLFTPLAAAQPDLIEAARSRDPEQLRRAVASAKDLMVRGSDGETALHAAAAACNVEAARILVAAGLDKTALDNLKRTAASVAALCRDPEVKNGLIRLLFVPPPAASKPTIPPGRWTLQDAAARGDVNVLDMLLKMGADVNDVSPASDRALEIACRKGNAQIVSRLLAQGADYRLGTGSGTSLLHEAALGGNAQVVEALLDRGVEINAPDKENGATPLHYAGSFGRVEVVKVLMRRGADARRKDRRGLDPLQLALTNNQTEAADVLRTRKAQ